MKEIPSWMLFILVFIVCYPLFVAGLSLLHCHSYHSMLVDGKEYEFRNATAARHLCEDLGGMCLDTYTGGSSVCHLWGDTIKEKLLGDEENYAMRAG